jgi:hypothetical protein
MSGKSGAKAGPMQAVCPQVRLGFDIVERVFQVHGLHENGKVSVRKTLARDKVLEYFAQLPACLTGGGLRRRTTALDWSRCQ